VSCSTGSKNIAIFFFRVTSYLGQSIEGLLSMVREKQLRGGVCTECKSI